MDPQPPRPALPLRACTVDWVRGEAVHADGRVAHLSPRELELLAYLADRADRVVPRSELLGAVFGFGPRTVSRAPDTIVRRLREKLERDPSRPDHLLTVYGEGYRFAPAPPAVLADAPDEAEPFVGRSAEVRALVDLLGGSDRGGRILVIRGPPGAGKTRLAHHVAGRLGPALGGGAVTADLTEARDLPQVAVAVAGALGVAAPEPGSRVLARAGDALRGRGPCLVMLDNCEGVTDAVGDALRTWRGLAPDARFLATSRSALPQADDEIQLGPMPLDDAVRLFEVLARRVRPAFRLDEVRDVVEALVERLERLPLAIALAAGRAGALSPRAILERLDDRFRLLASRSRDATTRQRTLRAALDASWDQLPDPERAVFLACAVFRGGFDPEALAALAGAEAVARVEALCHRSLLERRGARYGGYAFVRAYAEERLAADPALEGALHRRHAAVFAERVRGTPAPDRGRLLAADRANLVIAAERAAGADWDDAGELLAATILGALDVIGLEGPFEQAAALLDTALACPRLPDRERIRLLLRRGRLDLWTGHDDPFRWMDQATALAAALGDPALQADALRHRALAVRVRRSPSEALPLLEEAVRLAGGPPPDPVALTDALGALGATLRALGRSVEAEAALRESLRIAETHPQAAYTIGLTLASLATVLRRTGRLDEARALIARALAREEAEGDLRAVATVLSQLGNLEVTGGRWAEAEAAYRRALDIARQVGIRDLEARLYGNLALCSRAAGRLDEAEDRLGRAIAGFEALGERQFAVQARGNLGIVALDRGDAAAAIDLLDAAVRALDEAGDTATACELRGPLIVARVAAGDLARARAEVDRAEPTARRIGNPHVLAQILAARGRLERAEGNPAAARATLREAEPLVAGLDPTADAARAVAALRAGVGG